MSTPSDGAAQPAGGTMSAIQKQHEAAIAQVARLRTEMEAIKGSTNPEERKKLMQIHLASMANGLKMLQDSDCGSMMASGKCPMMQNGQHAQEQGAMTHHGDSMGMGHGDMEKGMDQMAQCHGMMQVQRELTNSLLEQLIAMQGQLILDSGK